MLAAFALAGTPKPLYGSALPGGLVGQEVFAQKSETKELQSHSFGALFANSQAQQLGLSIEYAGVGGALPEPSLMAAHSSSLIGYKEPPQGAIPARSQASLVQQGESESSFVIRKHTVKSGENITAIAHSYGLSLNTLLWANDLSSPDLIREGDELIILPVDGALHEVRSGETVSAIASRYKADAQEILNANDIAGSTIFAGQQLIIPGATVSQSKPGSTSGSQPLKGSSGGKVNVFGYFIRPTTGRLTQGIHGYNGVDIANSCWTPVYAAASGTVDIASGGSRWNGGYGNFASIKHANGTSTLYAHMIKVATAPGQYVSQGQVIGYIGSTGRSTGCHLHFEVRGAVNPIR